MTTVADKPETDHEVAKRAGWRANVRRHWQWARWPLGAMGVLFLIVVIAFVWLWHSVNLPKDLPPLQSSTVVDAKGRTIATFEQNGLREPVKLDQVAPVVVDA